MRTARCSLAQEPRRSAHSDAAGEEGLPRGDRVDQHGPRPRWRAAARAHRTAPTPPRPTSKYGKRCEQRQENGAWAGAPLRAPTAGNRSEARRSAVEEPTTAGRKQPSRSFGQRGRASPGMSRAPSGGGRPAHPITPARHHRVVHRARPRRNVVRGARRAAPTRRNRGVLADRRAGLARGPCACSGDHVLSNRPRRAASSDGKPTPRFVEQLLANEQVGPSRKKPRRSPLTITVRVEGRALRAGGSGSTAPCTRSAAARSPRARRREPPRAWEGKAVGVGERRAPSPRAPARTEVCRAGRPVRGSSFALHHRDERARGARRDLERVVGANPSSTSSTSNSAVELSALGSESSVRPERGARRPRAGTITLTAGHGAALLARAQRGGALCGSGNTACRPRPCRWACILETAPFQLHLVEAGRPQHPLPTPWMLGFQNMTLVVVAAGKRGKRHGHPVEATDPRFSAFDEQARWSAHRSLMRSSATIWFLRWLITLPQNTRGRRFPKVLWQRRPGRSSTRTPPRRSMPLISLGEPEPVRPRGTSRERVGAGRPARPSRGPARRRGRSPITSAPRRSISNAQESRPRVPMSRGSLCRSGRRGRS